MAIIGAPEGSRGVMDSIKGMFGLFGETNKSDGKTPGESGTPEDAYESKMSDEEIMQLTRKWKDTYSVYFDPIKKTQELAFDYWIGKHRADDSTYINNSAQGQDLKDNLLFEAIETFLPIATRANPDPLVTADDSEIGQQLAHDIKVALVHEADVQKLRRKLAKMTRHWVLNRIGVVKIKWDVQTNSIKTEVLKPNRMIFDKDGYIDEGGHFVGDFLGEEKSETAQRLGEMFPKKADFIKMKSAGKKATKIKYIEWWYHNQEVFYTLDDEVLGKYKNPHWNYDGTVKEKDPMTGEETEVEIQGTNHLKEPLAPYIFLSIFNASSHPHDDTSLMLQNISIQDVVNRRWRQIDKNVDGMNNGMVVSGTAFTEEQASQAASALRRGVSIRVPNGSVKDAVMRFPAPNLPADVFNNLRDARQEIRNIFGTAGSSAQGVENQETVRGKIMINQMDSSRIGGGVTEYIEQVADSIYNYWVQMMFVYYEEEHLIADADAQATQLIKLKNDQFPLIKSLNVTVKEGSLIPKDPLTQRNESIDLWSAGAIDPKSLYKKLDYPDPEEAAKQLLLWKLVSEGALPPQAYIADFQTPPQQLPQQGVGGPAVNNIGQEGQGQMPSATSNEAVNAQSQQLLNQVPI
jgi:hypothetical protein